MHRSESDLKLHTEHIQEFCDHWGNCKSLISENNSTVLSLSKIETVFYHVGKIILLVVDEHSPCNSGQNKLVQGSYLQAVLQNNVFESILIWIEASPTLKDEKSISTRDVLRRNLIIAFEQLITQSKQNVLFHRQILQPLCQLLFKLSSQLRPSYDQIYGRLLHSVCILMCRNFHLLEFSRQLCKEIFNQSYMIFSLLVPLVHRNDTLGDAARDSFLLIFAISKKDDNLGQYLAYESDICPVLAAGLSGLYSSLPKKLVPRYSMCHGNTTTTNDNASNGYSYESPGGPVSVTTPVFIQSDLRYPCLLELQVGGAEWHQLTERECSNSIDLRRFLHTLDFCNLTVKIAHPHVRDQLLHFIHSGFLIPVLGSALHQSAMDEVIAATAYLELFLRRLTEPLLIRLFLRFIVIESHDSYHILTSIMNRLNASAVLVTDKRYQLGMVTLSLFRTILSFHCEDVMYELIFKHLLALNHLDPEKYESSNNLHKTPLTASSLSLSSNTAGGMVQPKLCWSASPRLNSLSSMRNASCNQHPSVSQLIPHLVKSAELFLSLANTSSSSNDKLIESRHHSRTSSEVGMNTSLREEKRKKISSVSYCPVEKLRNNSKEFIFTGLTPNTDPLKSINLHDNDNRTDEFTDDEMNKGLNSNEWVVIRTVHPILLTDNYPELINYIKNASLRVSRRRQACKSWHSQYWPKTTEITNISSSSSSKCTPVTDDILELQERQAQQDLYKTTSSNYLNDCSLSPSTKYHAKLIEEHEKCLKNDNEDVDDIGIGVYDSSSSSVHLHSLSLQHASSLYQLNYLNDFSDEENCHENDKEDKHVDTTTTTTTYNNFTVDTVEREDNNNLLSISTDRNLPHACSMESFHSINHSKVNSSQLSKLAPKFKNYPEKQMNKAEVTVMKKNVDHDDNVIFSRIPMDLYSPSLINSSSNCTCLSTLPDLLRLAHLDGNSIQVNNHNSFISIPYNVSYLNNEIVNDNINKNERREYELENFLAALDCLPSPGHCTKHFGHLSPFISYSKIDDNFLKKLDEYIKEFEQSQLNIDTLTSNITTITTSITNAKNENVSSNYDDEIVDSKYLKENMLTSSTTTVKLSTDCLDCVSLNKRESIHSDNNSSCSSNGGGGIGYSYSHLTDFSSTSSSQSARHNSNSIGVAGGIGPFLSILLNRLANMHNNCFFTNLLLTDIFSALASYPCPLLYEFLLNPAGLNVKPSVNTLYKVLRSVNSQIVVASESVEQWKSLVFRARVYLNTVWPGPFKMTIDPNFYATKGGVQKINKTKTTPSSRPSRDVSEDRNTTPNASHSRLPDSTNRSTEIHPHVDSVHKDSLQHIVPLLPVVYPVPSVNNNSSSKVNSQHSHRSSATGNSISSSITSHIRNTSRSRINQLLGITSRIALSPVLKRASLQPSRPLISSSNHRRNSSKSKLFNSGSEDEDDNATTPNNDFCNDSGIEGSHSKVLGTSFYSDAANISIKTRNLVYASIVFDEFCYELASICYEHSLNPCIPSS